jgi:putative nucleotidyltransferase with HDIG domain
MGITLAVDQASFLLINLLTGTIGALFSTHLKKRKEFFAVSLKMWLVTAILVVAFNLGHKTILSETILLDFATTALNLFLLALLLVGLTPIFESFFGIMTDMTLMEFMDPTNALLKRLSIEAPGTYQHSLSLGFIAEHVANSIGANGLFCRVTTLYHDIGKLNTPHYYTENQMLMGGNQFDIHQLLTPIESAYIIKAHVQDGATLAYQNNLPQSFIDIIYQHHGTTLIKFFYAKQVAEFGGNAKDIDENAFRYPGPKPQTKEAAIIMLADSLEAASRSLDDNSEETIRSMVDRIAADKISDNQFDECPLTFHELSLIKIKFVEIIKATHHLRIKYPENLSKKK